ncbi:MAG: AAA family ATPase [Desulfuromonadales bacterium]|nr:AAA family ATPase [Desulfuromonadales bacterium]
MRVLRLRFKNLNSLAGEWDIDFTHPDYVSSGIFAITGPTGSGKTTILDAICVALYGQTPRLNKITQSGNEIMSRQTGECWAEVEFETARGRFRCHWSQHRSRRRADGQLQPPKHEIVHAGNGTILESKLTAVAKMVEEVTGMDFERFTRSMLLAQGGFAAFLQASSDKRAPILEQITGTAIYSRISIKVHECTTEQRKHLGEMRAELDGIQLLSSEEAEKLRTEKTELQLAEGTLSADAGILRDAQAWRERIAALHAELLQLDQDRIAFETRKAAADPQLRQLETAERAQKLGSDYAHILQVRSQQKEEQGHLTAAAERLPRLQLDWQAAFDALEQTESGLAQARIEQTREAELIRITRGLDVKLGEAQLQLQGMVAEIEKIDRRNGDYRTAITECDHRLRESEEELQEIARFLAEHQADAGLVEALTGIEQQLRALESLTKQCRDTSDRLVSHGDHVKSATLIRSQTETVWQGTRQAVSEAENRLAVFGAARKALLQGRDLSAWRDQAETLAARHNRLGLIQETLVRSMEVTHKLAELNLRGETLEQKRQALADQEQTLAGEAELREQVAHQIQENVLLINRVQSLEEDRRQLKDGVPCPLCGAIEHPYAAGNIPRLDQARTELKLALAEAHKVQEQLSLIRLELVAVVKDQQQAGLDLSEFQKRLLADQTFCENTSRELGLTVKPDQGSDVEAWLEVMDTESKLCREELLNRRGIIKDAEQKEQEERSAQTALDRLKDRLAEHDQARLAAQLGQESALAEALRLESESALLLGDLQRALAQVERAVAAYGFSEIVPDRSDQLLTALTARRTVYHQKLQARERLEKGRADFAAEGEKQRALLAESEKTRNHKEQQLRDNRAQRDTLVEQRLEQYGERNPDREEKRLADALRQAGERREAALQEQNRLQIERGGLNQQIERLTLSINQRRAQLFEREAAFRARLADAGFTDESDFLQACLPQERFDELTQWADNLAREETALLTRQQDRREALAVESDKKLTDKPLDLIREEYAAVTARLGDLHKAFGGIEQKLQRHAEQQQLHRDRLQALEMQKKECARWERLHSLIGSSDGKKFRNFAQGLTFELMVAHANRQLQKMNDRYILVRDADEPLELNVIDNYQAGEIRSTKNLSGGESFIASLALSLGLSSMASRNVAVDSLYLDEGFGTLDEDALETALETLSGLQQDGKLIGIISHVPALKERIGTQIQVEAGSAGRSRLSGPGVQQL